MNESYQIEFLLNDLIFYPYPKDAHLTMASKNSSYMNLFRKMQVEKDLVLQFSWLERDKYNLNIENVEIIFI